MALKERHSLKPWSEWPIGLAQRSLDQISAARSTLRDEIESHKYRQWQFFAQWSKLKSYANARGVQFIGDISEFVAYDSADVWSNVPLFELDKNLAPLSVSEYRPTILASLGNCGGIPFIVGDLLKKTDMRGGFRAFRSALAQSDIVRIDHFRGFYNYWKVSYGEKTAVKGEWAYGPGADLFRTVTEALGQVSIIAEDLGDFDKASRNGVDNLRAAFGYPGMKVLQFAFGMGRRPPFFRTTIQGIMWRIPCTHDNDTATGWYQAAAPREQDRVRRYWSRWN